MDQIEFTEETAHNVVKAFKQSGDLNVNTVVHNKNDNEKMIGSVLDKASGSINLKNTETAIQLQIDNTNNFLSPSKREEIQLNNFANKEGQYISTMTIYILNSSRK